MAEKCCYDKFLMIFFWEEKMKTRVNKKIVKFEFIF